MTKRDFKTPQATTTEASTGLPEYSDVVDLPRYDQALALGTSLRGSHGFGDAKEATVDVDAQSLAASTTSTFELSTTLLPDPSFQPGHTFILNAHGIRLVRIPVPSAELQINIYNLDGTTAYTSTRPRQSKGDAILSSATLGPLVTTDYFFGPSKPPCVRLQGEEPPLDPILTVSPHGRKLAFSHRDTLRSFLWSYETTRAVEGDKAKVLALRVKTGEGKEDTRLVAQLIRSNATRTPNTKRSDAGNGGQLVLAQDATSYLDEALIMATCVMMLKREIDRRRFKQFVFLMTGVFLC